MNFCPFIDTTLIFTEDCITPCYTNFFNEKPFYLNQNSKDIKNLNFIEKKEAINKIINSEEINKYPCKDCCHITQEETKFKKYNHFILSLWGNNSFNYDFFEIIKSIYNENMVDKENLIVEIQSGNLADFKELDKVISIFNQKGYKEIHFMINNVIYHPMIESILNDGKGYLYIIPNTRNNELKNRYSDVKNTLRRYLNAAKDKNAITIYYELIQGINDDKMQIIEFVNSMYTCGINKIALRLDNNDISKWLQAPMPLKDCPKHYASLILLFFKLCGKYSFYVDMNYKEQNIVFNKIFKSNKKQKKKR